MIYPGSYFSGFAPRDFAPAYPGLWRGCVGAWCPGLGPTGGTLRDWSGYQNHGTLTNMDGSQWDARSGRLALNFIDNAVSPNRVEIADSSVFEPTRNLSVSCWFYARTTSDMAPFAKWGSATGSYLIYLGQDAANSKFGCGLRQSDSTLKAVLPSSTSYVINTWYHLCMTADGATIRLYVNGADTGTTTAYNGTILNTTENLRIGTLRSDNIYRFNGYVDDCFVHDRALTPNEVRTLSLRRGIAYEPDLRSLYPFGVGSTANRRRRYLIAGVM